RMTSDEERAAQLRSLVSSCLTPYYDTHFNLLRWLQAYPTLSVDKVAHKLRHHLMFRTSEWKVDELHEKKRGYHPIHKYWPTLETGMSGVIPNCVVFVDQGGNIDHDAIHENFSHTEILKAKLYDVEAVLATIMRVEKETGKQATVLFVIDFDGFQYSKKLVDLLTGPMMSRAEFLLTHYVELFKHIVIVNCPAWANAVWAMLKHLLPQRTRDKLCLLSSSSWRDEIASLMDPSIGPAFWNNEKHSEFKLPMERPPRVPILDTKNPLEKLDKLHLRAGKEHWMEYDLEKGDVIAIHVTSNSSFGFTIVHEESDTDDVFAMRPVFPLFTSVHGTNKTPIKDEIIIPVTGTYKVWFSNAQSWFSSVTIHHSVEILKNSLAN
ncbi:hypothetical protein PMAYCL1PPCAC_15238, partial [Pristionchus mayeri]